MRTELNVRGCLDEVDASLPKQCQWDAAKLKNSFMNTRSDLTIAVGRRSRYGQNNPNNFHEFLRVTTRGELTADSKRVWIIFTAANMGTVNVDDRLMRLFSHTLPDSLANSNAVEGLYWDENEDIGQNGSHGGARADQSMVSRGRKRRFEASGASSEFASAIKIVCSTTRMFPCQGRNKQCTK